MNKEISQPASTIKEKRAVFNNTISFPFAFSFPKLTLSQENEIVATLFEQLLLFDKIVISTNRLNHGLYFLIKTLGINTVENLIESGYITFLIWTPVLFTSQGTQKDDGSIDESSIYGKPPIVAGSISNEEMDPEKNIKTALKNFQFHRDRVRIFTRLALKSYIIPNGLEISSNSMKLIIDAYSNNNLSDLGLPFEKEAEQLNYQERFQLLQLGHRILETSILANYNLKSYENLEHFSICTQNFKNIGKAYNIAANSEHLFSLENIPNLKQLFLNEKLNFETVFKIRHLSNAKYFRKWINEVGEDSNSLEITREYLNEVKGNKKFFERTEGKLLKHLSSLGINAAIGTAIAGPIGGATGIAYGLLESFWIDSILKGNNPSMFIDQIKREIKNNQD